MLHYDMMCPSLGTLHFGPSVATNWGGFQCLAGITGAPPPPVPVVLGFTHQKPQEISISDHLPMQCEDTDDTAPPQHSGGNDVATLRGGRESMTQRWLRMEGGGVRSPSDTNELVLFKIWANQSFTQLIVHKEPRVEGIRSFPRLMAPHQNWRCAEIFPAAVGPRCTSPPRPPLYPVV